MSTNIQQPTWVADLHTPRWLWVLLLALPLVALIAFIIYQSTQVLPRIALAPGYSLIDQDGKRLTNEGFRGSLVIYTFTGTRCTAPCPDTSHTLQQLHQALSAPKNNGGENDVRESGDLEIGGIPLHFVTISTDPEHDTPQRLRAYASQLGADTARWHFVSSDPEPFNNIIQATSQGQMISSAHSSSALESLFALVDGWGIVRAIYRTATPDLELIKRDLRLVAQEARNSTGVNRYAYETVHLFMCHNDLMQVLAHSLNIL